MHYEYEDVLLPEQGTKESCYVDYRCREHQQFPLVRQCFLFDFRQCYFDFFKVFFHKGMMPLLTRITTPKDAKHKGIPTINP